MSKFYYTIFSIVGLTVIIYAGVDLFYKIVGVELRNLNAQRMNVSQAPETKQEKRPPVEDYAVITSRNLFGTPEKPPVTVKETEIETLEPTTLKIALLGTVAGNQQNAVAVIEETDKREQGLYRIGDSVQSAIVKAILRGKVVLRVGDKDEILTMEESSSSGSNTPEKGPTPETPSRRSKIRVSRADVEKSLENVNDLLSQVRIRPHFQDGKSDGLALSHIRPKSIFAKMGLRNGDIVQGIDDTTINSPEDILSFYDKLKSGSAISLQISRRGRKRTIDYQLR